MLLVNKGGEVLKKLWCCVDEEYYRIIWLYKLGRQCELCTVLKRFRKLTFLALALRSDSGLTLKTSAFESLYSSLDCKDHTAMTSYNDNYICNEKNKDDVVVVPPP